MSTTPGNPTPPPLNEADMLEWIEGRLSRIAETERARGARAGVTGRVRQMQANRRALQSVGVERAPAELMERVLAALERDALLGLSNGQEVSDHLPISIATARVKEKTGNRRSDRWAGWALAAGLTLLVSGAAYWGSTMILPRPRGEIAINTPEPSLVKTPESIDKPMVLAKAEERPMPAAPGAASDAFRAASAPDAAFAEITPSRALELARQGRLVIRVFSSDLSGLAKIDAMETSKVERGWKVTRNVSPTVLAAIMPSQPLDLVGPPEESHGIALASSTEAANRLIAPMLGPAAAIKLALNPEADAVSRLRGAYVVDLPSNEKTLASVQSTFTDRLHATVMLQELAEPLDLPMASDPEALLWWTLPTSAWPQRVMVPVVVEGR